MALASTDDIAARRGRGDLTDAEAAQATFLLDAVGGVIAEACGKTDDWVDTLNPVPAVLRFVCVEVVCRAMANPDGLQSEREQLGAHSYAATFSTAGVTLSDREERMVRRAVFGSGSGSVRVLSIADDLYPGS